MKNYSAAIVVFLVVLVCMVNADTITLQEGVNGYSGCIDSYIGHGGDNACRAQNYGTAPTMLYGYEQFTDG
ncbi:hypothetical protein ACFLS1_11940 [Verrucomicrobiota bacterium]